MNKHCHSPDFDETKAPPSAIQGLAKKPDWSASHFSSKIRPTRLLWQLVAFVHLTCERDESRAWTVEREKGSEAAFLCAVEANSRGRFLTGRRSCFRGVLCHLSMGALSALPQLPVCGGRNPVRPSNLPYTRPSASYCLSSLAPPTQHCSSPSISLLSDISVSSLAVTVVPTVSSATEDPALARSRTPSPASNNPSLCHSPCEILCYIGPSILPPIQRLHTASCVSHQLLLGLHAAIELRQSEVLVPHKTT
jgi:hypothetical protein